MKARETAHWLGVLEKHKVWHAEVQITTRS